ncbi:hypothetical protein B0A52_04945 [Exophiala mesophila]|uniref:Xylanolytic transcriptional activator regulatory domain-containing protein n=1 Tax=Exophiala mesophila TaxID=212818 RepID=A0A438N751_EXOME|nr:hypothetical protein B0A52_04945 [Exophiala mesophila]
MTPRSNQSPSVGQPTPPAVPSVTTGTTAVGTNDSDSDTQPEERPTHTSEIGTLKKLPNHQTAWLGSSSGVYFVNTVRRAFSAAFASSHLAGPNAVPASEDILTGEDADGHSYNGPLHEGPSTTDPFPHLLATSLGKPPDRKIANDLVMSFFTTWHPLFPFLHGPTFLKDMELLYQRQRRPSTTSTTSPAPHELRRLVTFQLIINVASLDRSDIHLPAESRIRSTADVSRVAGCFALSHDLSTIQALLAAELYLVASLAIRQASTVAGAIVKLIYHAGLHRCPLRYAQLSQEDCDIRKRIFWSAYALDRHCSLSLGDPNTIQDDDIDVCLSGPELHKAVIRQLILNTDAPASQMPPPRLATEDPRVQNNDGPEAREKRTREAALTAYVQWSKLTGQIIEVFHKSINHRFPKHQQILRLTSDIETWWNDLPPFLTGEADSESLPDPEHADNTAGSGAHPSTTATGHPASGSTTPHFPSQQNLAPFFKILYHRLLLLVNRPRLSLDQSTPEFQHGLQVCIRASRGIVTGLKEHKQSAQSMFLPGLLSAAWMSGLIIAFACQLGKYAKARALSDMQACLNLLDAMNSRWYTVGNCHKVLSLLLVNIQGRKASINGFLTIPKPSADNPSPSVDVDPVQPSRKRQRTNADEGQTPPRKSSGVDSAHSSPVQPPSNANPPRLKHHPSSTNNSTPSWAPSAAFETNNPTALSNPSGIHASAFDFSHWDRGHPTTQPQYNHGIGSAVYATPQDLAFAQSTMNIASGSGLGGAAATSNNSSGDINNQGTITEYSDPMFWGNMDYNVTDIFGSATWENMTGPFAPGGGVNTGWEM